MLLDLVALRIACRSVDFQATPVGRSVLPLPFPRIRHGYSPRRHSFLFFGTGQALLGSRRLPYPSMLPVCWPGLFSPSSSSTRSCWIGCMVSRLLVGLPPRIRFLSHICSTYQVPCLSSARARTHTHISAHLYPHLRVNWIVSFWRGPSRDIRSAAASAVGCSFGPVYWT